MTTTVSGSYPAVNSDSDATINGLTVGKGGGAVATNTAVGSSALSANTTGAYMTAVNQSLRSNTSGNYNVGIGWALNSNTTGSNNVGTGLDCLAANTTGGSNTAYGVQALTSNTTASNNTAVGYQAGYSGTTFGSNAGFNTFLGSGAGYACTGSSNVLIGANAGVALTSGQGNLIIGGNLAGAAGGAMTTGSKNTLIGSYSGNQGGLDIRTASNYIVLSDGDGNPRIINNNVGDTIIGATDNPSTAKLYVYKTGNRANIEARQGDSGGYNFQSIAFNNGGTYYHCNFQEGATQRGSISSNGSSTTYATSSDYRLKNNIEPMTNSLQKVLQLKPSVWKWKSTGKNGEGFIAHELQEICPEAVVGQKDAVDENDNPLHQMVDTSFLVATLTAAIQELKAEVDSLKQQLGK